MFRYLIPQYYHNIATLLYAITILTSLFQMIQHNIMVHEYMSRCVTVQYLCTLEAQITGLSKLWYKNLFGKTTQALELWMDNEKQNDLLTLGCLNENVLKSVLCMRCMTTNIDLDTWWDDCWWLVMYNER